MATVIELEDEIEGNQIGSKDYRFSKIGEPVPIQLVADEEDDESNLVYDLQNPPSKPLAVSESLGILFIAHSTGFYVARTKDVIESAKEEGNRPSIQELSIVNLDIGKVSILTLSADSSMLVASVFGGAQLQFFSVSALLNKEQKPSFSCLLDDSSGIKDIQWTKKSKQYYVVLSRNGKLYYGAGKDHLKDVLDDVDAVEWSVRGNFIAVSRNDVISILTSKFEERLSISLSFKSLVEDSDVNCHIKVDSIKWIRLDCIVIGCFQLNSDHVEENYLVQVITTQDGKLTDASSTPVVISFNDVFLGFVDDAMPCGSGPYLFLSYLDQCELAFIANRKNTDQHIVLLGWSADDKKEVAMIEILNDSWLPRIDSQGNGDDNIVLGLSIDRVSQDGQVKLILGEEENEVPPCCVVLCLTIDGKLTVFHFASGVGASARQDSICTTSEEEEDAFAVVNAENETSEVKSKVEQTIEQVDLGLNAQKAKEPALILSKAKEPVPVHKSLETNIPQTTSLGEYSQKQDVGHVPNVKAITKQEEKRFSTINLNQDGNSQLPTHSGQEYENSKQSMFIKSHLESPILAAKVMNKTETSNDTFPELLGMPHQSNCRDSPKGFNINMEVSGQTGLTAIQGSSFQSWPSGNINSSKKSYGESSKLPSTSIQMNQSVDSNIILSNAIVSEGPIQNLSYSKGFAAPSLEVNSYKHRTSGREGNIECLPVVTSSQVPLKEKFTLGKTVNRAANSGSFRASSPAGLLNAGPNLSKQYLNVEEIAKELDTLLENIEGVGGFIDSSTSLQKNSVLALEKGISTLSERCRSWRGIMNKRLAQIQLIFDKTVQVVARKIYMEGIVKQATDSRYLDLWSRQKLSSELELKRRRLLEGNQALTNQLIELERHFNSLELNKFGETCGVQSNLRASRSKHRPSRHANSLHSLHNTMNAQLAAAEQLSECLSQQMAALCIESPYLKEQNVRRELFEMIGIPYDDGSFISPEKSKGLDAPSAKKLLSSSSSNIAKAKSWRNQLSTVKHSEPETARRRRESLGRSWSSFNPPKTTVTRMLLKEDRQKVRSKSSLLVDKQVDFNFTETEQSKISTISYSSKLKGRHDALTTDSYENPSTLSFRADEFKSAPQSTMNSFEVLAQLAEKPSIDQLAVDDLKSVQQAEINRHKKPAISMRFPTQTLSSPKGTNTLPSLSDSQLGLSEFSKGNLKNGPIISESLLSGKSSKVSPVLASGSTPSVSNFGTSKSDRCLLISSSLMPLSSSASLPMLHASPPHLKPTTPNLSSGSLTTSSVADITVPLSSSAMSSGSLTTSSIEDIRIPLHGSPASASICQAPGSLVPPSTSPSFLNSPLKSQDTELEKFNLNADNKSQVLSSSPQPELQIGKSSSKFEPSVPSSSSELSTSSQPGSQLSFSGLTSSASHVTLEPKPKQPSPPPVPSSASLSNSGTTNNLKFDSSDVTFTLEDEMEEEAPEDSRSTELTIGSLGGFGIGSAPNPTAGRPNPFGGPFGITSNQPSASFTMTVPGGELFKPASFSFKSPDTSQPSHPTDQSAFTGGFNAGRFGHHAQTGSGQEALGSVLGSFGQSRQLGASLPVSGVASASGFGGFSGTQTSGSFSNAAAGGGFASMASAGGGFSGLASAGGGFSGVASAGGGFSSLAPAGGGFSGLASAGRGFSGVASTGGGFGAVGSIGGGFAATPPAGGGFGVAASGTLPTAGGGFGAFNNQGGGGFSSFGSTGGTAPPNLFTQIRK